MKGIVRRAWLLFRERPLFVIALVVIVVLGQSEVRSRFAGPTAEEKYATATARANIVIRATRVALTPVVDQVGVRDGETSPADYPSGLWVIGWAYNCGRIRRRFSLDLYDVNDPSFMHGIPVTRQRGLRGRGMTGEEEYRPASQFVILITGPCAWHVRVMRGNVRVRASIPTSP